MTVIYHDDAHADFDDILAYFEKVSERIADEFEIEFTRTLETAKRNPFHFHPLTARSPHRRANIPRFNHHFVYEISDDQSTLRILIIRHDKRHPSYGLNRRWS